MPDACKAPLPWRCPRPIPARSSQHHQGASCSLALGATYAWLSFCSPLPDPRSPPQPPSPPVLLWERAQQKATMVAMSTRKATPAPTATPMMTAIGTDSVGEKQAQLTRDPTAHAPSGLTQFPWVGAASAKRGWSALHRALLGSACRGFGQAQVESTGAAQVGHGEGERAGGRQGSRGGGRGRQADIGGVPGRGQEGDRGR